MMKLKTLLMTVGVLLCLLAFSGCSSEREAVPVETSRLGVMVGSTNEKYAEEHYPDAKKEHYNNYVDSSAALLAGKLDYAMMDYASALNFIKYNPKLKLASDPLTDEKYCIGISNKQPELAEKISAVLDRYLSDGTMDTIKSHWIKEDGGDYTIVKTPKVEGANAPVLKVVTVATREPTAFMLNGEFAGMEIELIENIAYELGYKIEYLDMPFSGVIAAMGSGKADVCTAIYKTPERAKQLLFSAPFFPNPQILITLAGEDAAAGGGKLTEIYHGIGESFRRTFIVEQRWKLVLSGLWTTVLISVCSMLLGTLFGALVCVLYRSKVKLLSFIAKLYVRLVQGMPMVVMLMILYYIVLRKVPVSAVFVAIIGFSMNFAAYTSEMFRTGVDAVDKGQREAAAASGFSGLQSFVFITLPQALRHILPVYKGEFISMVKLTSIVGYISIQDLTQVSDIIRSRTYQAFFPLIVTALIYFAVTYLFILILNFLEFKIDPKRRKRLVKGVSAHD